MSDYISRVNAFIVPYLKKNGYELIKTEFVSEDNNYYLRLYIDLTEEELAARKARQLEESEAAQTSDESDTAADKGPCGGNAEGCNVKTAESGADTGEDTGIADAGKASADAERTGGDGSGEEAITPGVSINDCVKVSRYLSKWLDKEDFIKEMYTMEVCSRGFMNNAVTAEDNEERK